MSKIKRGIENNSTLEEATDTFRYLTRLALRKSVWSEWESEGSHAGGMKFTLLRRSRHYRFSRMVPARYASIAYSPLYVNGTPAPRIVFGKADGKAYEHFNVAQTEFAPYTPDFKQHIGSLLERRYLFRLSAEAFERPSLSMPRPLTEEEALSFEPYGGPVHQVVLCGIKHTIDTDYLLHEDDDVVCLWRTRSNEDGINIARPLTTDADVPGLVELNRTLYDVLSTWK